MTRAHNNTTSEKVVPTLLVFGLETVTVEVIALPSTFRLLSLSLHLKTSRVSFSAHGYYRVCRLTAC